MQKFAKSYTCFECAGDRWAVSHLSASGEDVIGRLRVPQYLVLARTLLLPPLSELCIDPAYCHSIL